MFKSQRAKTAAVAFLLGLIAGAGLYALLSLAYNWLAPWVGADPIALTWGGALSMALVFAAAMAANAYNYTFQD